MINTDVSFFNDFEESQKDLYRKHPKRTMSKGYLFTISSANPTCVDIKKSVAAD